LANPSSKSRVPMGASNAPPCHSNLVNNLSLGGLKS
jgi:hypothetical protein